MTVRSLVATRGVLAWGAILVACMAAVGTVVAQSSSPANNPNKLAQPNLVPPVPGTLQNTSVPLSSAPPPSAPFLSMPAGAETTSAFFNWSLGNWIDGLYYVL
jgi:hypothetical protein